MGFEQLAELKRELTARAEQERKQTREKQKGKASARPDARKNAHKDARKDTRKDAAPVDPVVITISRLQKQFPKAFPKKPEPKVPLKLGIHKELHTQAEALKLTPEEITLAVKTWCQGSRYWACMVEDAPRVDLAGEPAGTVTAAEAQFAKKLAARRRTNAARSRKNTAPQAADATTPAVAQAADSTTGAVELNERQDDLPASNAVATAAVAGSPDQQEKHEPAGVTTPATQDPSAPTTHEA
ncbi:prop effector [Eoetvoesia caeni]|nr:prop effector [Eoetvoesiella caeni]